MAKTTKRSKKRPAAERKAYRAARKDLATGDWTTASAVDSHGRACIRLYWNGTATDKFCYSPEKASALIAKYRGEKAPKKVANPKRASAARARYRAEFAHLREQEHKEADRREALIQAAYAKKIAAAHKQGKPRSAAALKGARTLLLREVDDHTVPPYVLAHRAAASIAGRSAMYPMTHLETAAMLRARAQGFPKGSGTRSLLIATAKGSLARAKQHRPQLPNPRAVAFRTKSGKVVRFKRSH